MGVEQWKKQAAAFVCCRWPSGLSVCVATSSYQRYLCCDNPETDIGFQGFVTSHYPNTETFIALAYSETRRGIDCVKHPDGFLCQNIDEAAVVTGGSVLQTGSSWSSEQTLLQTHKVETESRIFIPTVRYHATQHELNKNMHPTRDGKHEPHSRFLSSQGTNWGRGRENQNPDWMR